MMERILLFVMTALLLVSLAACAGSTQPESNETQPAAEQNTAAESAAAAEAETESVPAQTGTDAQMPAETAPDETASAGDNTTAHSDVLVAYFSATGTTKGVAEKIAAITGGDLYEIVPAQPYSDADLNWNDRNSRSTKEQNDKSVRPGIGSEQLDLTGYKRIYLGFPIWWGEEPRIMDTFVESYDFDGMTLIPFCTSSSSGIGRSGPNMQALAGSGTWLDGERFGASVSEADLQSWIEGLK